MKAEINRSGGGSSGRGVQATLSDGYPFEEQDL